MNALILRREIIIKMIQWCCINDQSTIYPHSKNMSNTCAFVVILVQCPPKVLEQSKIFSRNFKTIIHLNALYIQYGSKIRPNETLRLTFGPYCLIPSISFCWKLVVLRWITWTMWLYKLCKFYKFFKNFWRALYVFESVKPQ